MAKSARWSEPELPLADAEELVARYVEGDLDVVERGRLARRLEDSPELARLFAERVDAAAEAHGPLGPPPVGDGDDELLSPETIEEYVAGLLSPDEHRIVTDEARSCPAIAELVARAESERSSPDPPAVSWLRRAIDGLRTPKGMLVIAAAAALLIIFLPRTTHWTQSRGVDPTLADRVGARWWTIDAARRRVDLAPAATVPHDAEIGLTYDLTLDDRPVYLLAFAVTATGDVVWYFPAWEDPADQPRAVRLDAAARPDPRFDRGRRYALPVGELSLVAVFTTEPASVADVEADLDAWIDGTREGVLDVERMAIVTTDIDDAPE